MNNAAYGITSTPMPAGAAFVSQSVSDAYFIGAGIGHEWNNWLRFEANVEYRARARYAFLGAFEGPAPGSVLLDQFEGYIKSWLFMGSAFVDLATWWDCVTPFVGAGIGVAMNQMDSFNDVTPFTGGASSSFGVGRGTTTWSMAWALYAGVAYRLSKTATVELTYRYLDLGSARETLDCDDGCSSYRFDFKNLYSHDFMLGLRWACCDFAPATPASVPPPVLQSKG